MSSIIMQKRPVSNKNYIISESDGITIKPTQPTYLLLLRRTRLNSNELEKTVWIPLLDREMLHFNLFLFSFRKTKLSYTGSYRWHSKINN